MQIFSENEELIWSMIQCLLVTEGQSMVTRKAMSALEAISQVTFQSKHFNFFCNATLSNLNEICPMNRNILLKNTISHKLKYKVSFSDSESVTR